MKNKIIFLMIIILQSAFIFSSESDYDKFRNVIERSGGVKKFIELWREKHGSLNCSIGQGKTFFNAIVRHNHVDIVKECIAQGVDTTQQDGFGRTAYSYARTPEMKAVFLKEAIDFCYDPTAGDNTLLSQRK